MSIINNVVAARNYKRNDKNKSAMQRYADMQYEKAMYESGNEYILQRIRNNRAIIDMRKKWEEDRRKKIEADKLRQQMEKEQQEIVKDTAEKIVKQIENDLKKFTK